jgi:hypothetical protein
MLLGWLLVLLLLLANVAAVTAIIVAVTAPGEGRVLARERSFPFAT